MKEACVQAKAEFGAIGKDDPNTVAMKDTLSDCGTRCGPLLREIEQTYRRASGVVQQKEVVRRELQVNMCSVFKLCHQSSEFADHFLRSIGEPQGLNDAPPDFLVWLGASVPGGSKDRGAAVSDEVVKAAVKAGHSYLMYSSKSNP